MPLNRWIPRFATGVLLSHALMAQPPVAASRLELREGEGTVLDYASEVARIYTSNPEVADPLAIDPKEVLVSAKAPGMATLVVWLKSGERLERSVRVIQDLERIEEFVAEAFPGEAIRVVGTKTSLIAIGKVSSAEVVDKVLGALKPFATTVIGNLEVAPPRGAKQIALHVIFAEVDRTLSDSFGVNLLSTGAANTPGSTSTGQFASSGAVGLAGTIGGAVTGTATKFNVSDPLNIFAFRPDLNLAVAIEALQSKGLLQILAEPTIVATEGKEARFMVGGEFPVPVIQAGSTPGAVTVQYREFGIRLQFTPRTTAYGTIQLHVAPEVSALDVANGVVISGFSIPALATRRMETDVELREKQSFVIAGLLDDRVTQTLSKVPGISEIPILGALFRSHSRSRSKTELVVIVTPEICYPLPEGVSKPIPVMPVTFLPPLVAPAPAAPKGNSK